MKRTARGIELLAIAAVVLVFAATVFVRAPYLDDPMSGRYNGEGTARVLRHMDVWNEVGLAETTFMMRTTGTADGDRFIRDVGWLSDEQGVHYYASFPPLFPLAPHAVFRLLGIGATPMAVRVFNLFLHALTCLGLFLLARRAALCFGHRFAAVAGAVAAIVYAVAPMAQWYHSNAYVTASLSTPLLVFSAFLAVKLAHDEAPGAGLWVAYIACVAGLAYTDWVSLTFGAAVVLLALLRRGRRETVLAGVTVAAIGAVLGITFLQYSSIAGVDSFLDGLTRKYEMRSGVTERSHYGFTDPDAWSLLRRWFSEGALQAGIVALVGGLTFLSFRPAAGESERSVGRAFGSAVVLVAGAVLMHHALLFSHTVVHAFDMMKTIALMALLAGALAAAGLSRVRERRGWVSASAWAALVVALFVVTVTGAGEDRFATFTSARDFGTAVQESAVTDEEVVFIEKNGFYRGSVAAYYAGRSLASYDSEEEAAELMALTDAPGGLLVVMDEEGQSVEELQRLAPDGTVEGPWEPAEAGHDGS